MNNRLDQHAAILKDPVYRGRGYVPVPARPSAAAPAHPAKAGNNHGGRLETFLAKFHKDDRVLIIINADPDAIASAAAVKRLLSRRVGQVLITSVNQVKRPDNLQLIASLKLPLPLLSAVKVAQYNKLVMVDSQPDHSPQTAAMSFTAVIDHHPRAAEGVYPTPEFVDIRPDWGATASLLSLYLKAAKIKPNRVLATALFYAIKTDTQNFVRQGQLEDMRAFRWLFPMIHPPLLSDIERAPIDRSSFKRILKGLNQAVFKKNMAYTFLDKVDHADSLVILADFLMQINTVNRTVSAGVCEGKLIVVMRAAGLRQNVGRVAKEAFGAYGSAGGHRNMARAEMPLENLPAKDGPQLNRFVTRRLHEAISSSERKIP